MTEQEWEDKLDEVQKHSENWYNKYKDAEKRITELENQIADIKANCDLAIEGRDVKIKDLEKENTELKERLAETNLNGNIVLRELTKATDLLKRCYENYIYLEPLRSEIEQFLQEIEK